VRKITDGLPRTSGRSSQLTRKDRAGNIYSRKYLLPKVLYVRLDKI